MSLPIHFFTIVLNGEPFIRYHLARMQALKCDWHWHIIEGLAELKHDTAWSLPYGATLPTETVREGRSIDGTAEYLDHIARENPDRITLYRAPTPPPPAGRNWDGKLEMICAPMANIPDDSLLWEIDSDELWTTEQFELLRHLFLENPERTAAVFFCWYFVAPTLVINRKRRYPEIQWRRAWRFKKGMRWIAHEPPVLAAPIPGSKDMLDVAAQKPFSPAEMDERGLVFQHFAYATERQLAFKEKYYGYRGITDQWKALQAYRDFPVRLRQFLNWPWVDPEAMVDPVDVCGILPLARFEHGGWDLSLRPNPWESAAPDEILLEKDRYVTGWKLGYHLLARIIERYQLKVGAEVGVALGGHSSAILERTGVQRLYGIDPYLHRDNYEDMMNLPQGVFDVMHRNVARHMAQHGERFKLLRMDSVTAAAQVTEPLDFVYIDGDHSYEGVKRDLETWFPKVRDGGIISGHDYASSSYPGVTKAIGEFMNPLGLAVRSDDEYFWWVQKGDAARFPATQPLWKRGVLYLQRGVTNALTTRSLRSLATHHPELRIHVVRINEGVHFDKRVILERSIFEETLFLDADTVILGRLDFGFEMARRHGLACCISECPWARRSGTVQGDLVEYNPGVLFYTAKSAGIFNAWAAQDRTAGNWLFDPRDRALALTASDRVAFSMAVAQSPASPFILPANWNFRPQWQKTWWGPIKIWHDAADPPQGVLAFSYAQAQPDAIIQYISL